MDSDRCPDPGAIFKTLLAERGQGVFIALALDAPSARIARLPQLQYDGNRQGDTRMPAVIKVIPIAIVDVKVVGVIPVFCPVFGPRINQHERKATILEAWISHEYRGAAADAERV